MAWELRGWGFMGTSRWGWQGWVLSEEPGIMGRVPTLGLAPGDVWGQGLHGDPARVGTEVCEFRQEGYLGYG